MNSMEKKAKIKKTTLLIVKIIAAIAVIIACIIGVKFIAEEDNKAVAPTATEAVQATATPEPEEIKIEDEDPDDGEWGPIK